jgi:hypothetical protein
MEIVKQWHDDRRWEKTSSIVIDWYKLYSEEGLPRKVRIEQAKMMAQELLPSPTVEATRSHGRVFTPQLPCRWYHTLVLST